MPRDTLIDFFDERIRSPAAFVTHDDGYRARTHTYDDIRAASQGFARRLAGAGVEPGGKVIVWGENCPDWIVALWGCLLARAVLVPVDYRASAALVARVAAIVDPRVLLVGDGLAAPPVDEAVAVWPLRDLATAGAGPAGGGSATDREQPERAQRATSRRSSSRPAPPPTRRGCSSPTATSWRTSSRSRTRC